MKYDTIIVGGGAAAYSAAIYAARYNLKTLVIQKDFGGETLLAGVIHNWPGAGAAGIDGFELMQKMKKQAEASGVEMIDGEATLVSTKKHCMKVKVGKKSYEGKTLILCVGMEHRKLGLDHEDDLKGNGVHSCATCDGPLYKGKNVAVVGGGDSAVKSANQLLDMGTKHVFMIVREDNLDRAEPVNLDELKARKAVTYIYENEITALEGSKKLSGVVLKKAFKKKKDLKVDGLFVEIGSVPRDELPKQLGVEFDERGQINVDPYTMATNIDGVFAAGDVTNGAAGFKQIVTASAQGAIAATSAYKDTKEHAGFCELHVRSNNK